MGKQVIDKNDFFPVCQLARFRKIVPRRHHQGINVHLGEANSLIADLRKSYHLLHAQFLIQQLATRAQEVAKRAQERQTKIMVRCTIIVTVLTFIIAVLTAVITWATIFPR
jgi:hypothetical protein